MGNTCCSNKDNDRYESQEATRKEVLPGADLAAAEMVMNSAGSPPAAAKVGEPGRGAEFSISIDKSTGTRLGVDVDHQDGHTLLIDAITGGLAEKWNTEHPDCALRQGDRIVEVNGIRGDVLQLVEECKKSKVLSMKVLVADRGGWGPHRPHPLFISALPLSPEPRAHARAGVNAGWAEACAGVIGLLPECP
eukprot:CAMPEP_0204519440 /NCGR_PEP_ID=MMETSP0661-20131031/4734_1 /ASSEMBLY_ACC=CAM_ASM_000606 /TAXON_ID=109239 /ORGANISM="Alexandrium margalefi, Strain AMGDE01CS-322" /LENGTH=191 /DNA_ID=CAMNT_0051524943 /DNA_START=126 /DNA_END=698 /DNA_ORIENTATION=-